MAAILKYFERFGPLTNLIEVLCSKTCLLNFVKIGSYVWLLSRHSFTQLTIKHLFFVIPK